MERLCYVFTIFLSVLCSSQPASGQGGVFIEYGGVVLSNFGVGSHMDVGTDPNPNSVGTNLVCRTDSIDCCGGVFEVTQGSWYYPSGIQVQINSENTESLPSGQIYRQQGGDQVVRLRRLSGQSITTAANGIYRCEVADLDGVMQTRYFGLYTETNEMPNGVGVVSISQAPQFSLISVDPLEFTLTSTTTGGPPTTAFLALPDTTMVTPGDTFSQRVVDAVAATVEHTLTVTGGVTGTYTFSITNTRSGAPDSRDIIIEAANPPFGLMAVQSGLTSVTVSWTAPAPGGATRTGYRIFYETGGSEQSVDVGAGATSHTLTGLQSGATYSTSIVALSDTLPSTVLGPKIVTVEDSVDPTVTTMVTANSIRVTFTQPSGVPAERYDIQYTRVTGQTLCGSVEDTGSATDVQSPYTIENLQEFTTYSITVTAFAFGMTRGTTEQAMTSPAAPTAAPRNLMNTTVNSTSITVRWGPVECIDRNGVIDNYIVRFGPEGGAQSERTVQSEGIDQPGAYTASGLTPFTRYSFEVATVNSAGRGPFTAPLIVDTSQVPPPVVTVGAITATEVTLSWVLQSGMSQYEVHYLRAVGPQQLGACPDFIEPLRTQSTTENSLTVEGLQEFSTYTLTVFAANNGGRVPSENITIMTPETAPAAPAGLEVVNFTDTAITVAWQPLQCIDINSQFEITGYAVRYGFAAEPDVSTEILSSLPVVTINVLAPGFNYFIEVAAVNSNGETGAFSGRIMQSTSGGTDTTVAATVGVVLVVLILTAGVSAVIITVLVLKHRRTPARAQEPQPTEGVVLTTFSDSTKPPSAISTAPCAAYGPVAQGRDGDPHTYEYITPAPAPRSRDPRVTNHESHYESTT